MRVKNVWIRPGRRVRPLTLVKRELCFRFLSRTHANRSADGAGVGESDGDRGSHIASAGNPWAAVSFSSLCSFLLLLFGFSPYAQPSSQIPPGAESFIEAHFRSAKEAESNGQYSKAVEEYRTILRRYPRLLPEVYQNLGIAYYLQRKYEDAIATFTAGIKLKPVMLGARLFLGGSYVSLGQPEKALPHLRYAHKQKPTAESATFLALAFVGIGDHRSATPYFREALEKSEQKDHLLYLLGESYLKQATQLAPILTDETTDLKYAHFLTARVLDGQEWFQLAAKEYLDAAKLDPGYAAIFFSLARVFTILGQEAPATLALDRYRQLLTLENQEVLDAAALPRKDLADVGIRVNFEKQLRSLPSIDDGNRPLLPLVNSDVNQILENRVRADRSAQWKQVITLLLRARWDEALTVLQRITPAPGDWLRDYLMARVYAWKDDHFTAERLIDQESLSVEKASAVRMLRWEVLQQLSFIYFNQLLGEYPQSSHAHYLRARMLDVRGKKEAVAEYEAAIAKAPHQVGFRIALADFQLGNSRFQEALELCQQELEINSHSGAAKARIGRIYIQLRKPEDGMPYLKEALKANPRDAQARTNLAWGWELLGQPEKALAEYKLALVHDPSLNRLHYVLARLYRKLGQADLASRENQIFQENERNDRRKLLERVDLFRNQSQDQDP